MDTSVTRYIFPHCTVSAVARASREARPPVKIYNFTSGNSVPLKWGEIYGFAEHHLFQVDIYNIYNYIYNIYVFFFCRTRWRAWSGTQKAALRGASPLTGQKMAHLILGIKLEYWS